MLLAGNTARLPAVPLRPAYLSLTNTMAMLRLLPMGDRDEDLESAPCGTRSECCSGNSVERECGSPADRALLAGLHRLPRQTLLRLRLMVRPDAISRRHRDLLCRGHAPHPGPKTPQAATANSSSSD